MRATAAEAEEYSGHGMTPGKRRKTGSCPEAFESEIPIER